MSAQVTEAHRQAAVSIFKLAMKSSHHGAPFREPCAQLIADSEAKAVAPLRARISSDEELFHEIRMKLTAACGDPYKLHDEALDAMIAERDQLRAEVEQSHITRDATCIELSGKLREARAEVERLKTCGMTELAAQNSSVADYCKHWEARAERAEAELAFQVARNSDLFTERDDAVEAQGKAEAELTKERARLDWLAESWDNPLAINLHPSYGWSAASKNIRAAIDAAMKEGK